ncbi:phosphotransferase [Sphingosinicella sp. BN140058]|uniref:phosphotransferase n=1 Tax=Sphingosinicella sp. BN140058 TaxID=1892855 RepID=UPI0010122CBC|nr:phosphotransferase [Sphingosinicella sp. BN140058]QAY78208.1 hypothetical protein ETR14_17980 [Sphingosinicella sp. BN140058]
MILTRQNVLHYLLQAEHLGLEQVVDGRFQIASRTSRNRAFAVSNGRGPGLFVKQYRPEEGHWSRGSTVETEAAVYALAGGSARLAKLLPPLRGFDRGGQILVLDLFEPAESLRRLHVRTGRFSPPVLAALGEALATCHVEFGKALRFGGNEIALPAHRPWILRPDRLEPYRTPSQSVAQAKVVAIVQRHADLIDRLRALEAGWRVNGIIHGDMKWANCLIARDASAPDLRLVDWEMAGSGDVAWDVAGILHSCIVAWVRSTRPSAADHAEAIAATATIPLADLQGAARSFFGAYLDRIDLDAVAAAGLLSRAVPYAAARIVQTAFEGAGGDTLVDAHLVLALQLSANMLADPEAAAGFLGLET